MSELISGSSPEKHPQLLNGLFGVLAELRKYKSQSGSEMSYLEAMTLDNAYQIVKTIKVVTPALF